MHVAVSKHFRFARHTRPETAIVWCFDARSLGPTPQWKPSISTTCEKMLTLRSSIRRQYTQSIDYKCHDTRFNFSISITSVTTQAAQSPGTFCAPTPTSPSKYPSTVSKGIISISPNAGCEDRNTCPPHNTRKNLHPLSFLLYNSKTTSAPMPGHTILDSCRIDKSLEIDPSCATLWR